MRAAAIFGLGSSLRELRPFQHDPSMEWTIGVPAEREDLDAVLIFGGDGTVHRHLSSLVRVRSAVLVVPSGSGNDFARALGIAHVRDALTAWKAFVSNANNVRVADLGTITSREKSSPETYFCCAAGVGLDGEIARRANALPRWLRAHGGYALSLPPALLQFRAFDLKLSVSHGAPEDFCLRSHQPVLAAVFANTPVYGGGMRVAPTAKMDDGLLNVCVIRDIAKVKLLSVFPSVYLGKHLGIREVDYFPAARARIETDRPLDIYADGERVGRTPAEIGVAAHALRLIAP
jgi:diacylglycerol kinase (ATP)